MFKRGREGREREIENGESVRKWESWIERGRKGEGERG